MSDFVCCSGINIGALAQKVNKNERRVKNRTLSVEGGNSLITLLDNTSVSFPVGTVFQNCIVFLSNWTSDYDSANPYIISLPYTFKKCVFIPITYSKQLYFTVKNATLEDCEVFNFCELPFRHKGKTVQLYYTGDGFYYAPLDWDGCNLSFLFPVEKEDTKKVAMSLLREFCQSYLPSKKIVPSDIELTFEGLCQEFEFIFGQEGVSFFNSLFALAVSVFNPKFFTNCYFRFSKDFCENFLKKRSIQNGRGSESWVPRYGNWSMGVLFREGTCFNCYYSAIQDYWDGSTMNFYEDIVVYGGDSTAGMVCEDLEDFASFYDNWNSNWDPISICFKPKCWVDCPNVESAYIIEKLRSRMGLSNTQQLTEVSTSHETIFQLSSILI